MVYLDLSHSLCKTLSIKNPSIIWINLLFYLNNKKHFSCCLMCALKVCGIIWTGMEQSIFEIRRIYIRWKHPGFYFQLLKIESQTERPILNLLYWKSNICIKVLKEHVPVLDSSEFRILVILHESVQPLGFVCWSNFRKAFKRMKAVLNL